VVFEGQAEIYDIVSKGRSLFLRTPHVLFLTSQALVSGEMAPPIVCVEVVLTMVLDPLSAFSVACNVLQVIELGVKVLSKAANYRKAETGVLTEQKDLRDVLQSLNNLNTDLLASLPQRTASKQHTIEEARLLEANNQCLLLSKNFIDFLDRLKLRDRHAVFDSLRMSIKTLWHRDKMDAMEKSLSQARDNLNVSFLVYMKYVNKCQVYGAVMT
jgi:hypothetical protein